MRDLICGGCELASDDTTEFSPLFLARREHLRRPRQLPCLLAATPERHDQPENAGKCKGAPCQNSRCGMITAYALN